MNNLTNNQHRAVMNAQPQHRGRLITLFNNQNRVANKPRFNSNTRIPRFNNSNTSLQERRTRVAFRNNSNLSNAVNNRRNPRRVNITPMFASAIDNVNSAPVSVFNDQSHAMSNIVRMHKEAIVGLVPATSDFTTLAIPVHPLMVPHLDNIQRQFKRWRMVDFKFRFRTTSSTNTASSMWMAYSADIFMLPANSDQRPKTLKQAQALELFTLNALWQNTPWVTVPSRLLKTTSPWFHTATAFALDEAEAETASDTIPGLIMFGIAQANTLEGGSVGFIDFDMTIELEGQTFDQKDNGNLFDIIVNKQYTNDSKAALELQIDALTSKLAKLEA